MGAHGVSIAAGILILESIGGRQRKFQKFFEGKQRCAQDKKLPELAYSFCASGFNERR
jgi:hypothetical protein